MTANLSLITENIVLCELLGTFDVETYAVMEGTLPMMVRELPHTIGVILYLSSGAKLPNLSGILQEIGILCRVMPSNFCMFVGVGEGVLLANPLSMMLASFVLKRYYQHNQVKVARSIEQAITLINASCGDAG